MSVWCPRCTTESANRKPNGEVFYPNATFCGQTFIVRETENTLVLKEQGTCMRCGTVVFRISTMIKRAEGWEIVDLST